MIRSEEISAKMGTRFGAFGLPLDSFRRFRMVSKEGWSCWLVVSFSAQQRYEESQRQHHSLRRALFRMPFLNGPITFRRVDRPFLSGEFVRQLAAVKRQLRNSSMMIYSEEIKQLLTIPGGKRRQNLSFRVAGLAWAAEYVPTSSPSLAKEQLTISCNNFLCYDSFIISMI